LSHHLLMGLTNADSDLLPGTLELLVLKALAREARHGYAIVEHLRLASGNRLEVGESALYPALQRLLLNGWVKASWGQSENNRRARYYSLTVSGRKHLEKERETFERRIGLIQRVLEA
jgi:transcriptional regulator